MWRKDRHNKKIKRYHNFDFDTNAYVMKYYIDKEKAIIPIQIREYQELFSIYHPDNIVLNPDIAEYIEQIVYYIPYQYSVVLELRGLELTEEEKIHISSIFSQYFGMRAHDKKVDLRFNARKALVLLLFGFLFLSISYLLSHYMNLKFINDVVSIAGTFSIWELVNTLWLERTSIRVASLNAGQLATSTIAFKTVVIDKKN